jgi:non-heme chloroperoxidase
LILHGDDDQIVPFADSGPLAAKRLKQRTFKVSPGRPRGVCQTEPDMVNADLLAFARNHGAIDVACYQAHLPDQE